MYNPIFINLTVDMMEDELHKIMEKMAARIKDLEQGCVCTVDGYDNDDRELYDIPEVIALFNRLVNTGFISLLEVSTAVEGMRPAEMPTPFPGLGALEVWAMSANKYNDWFGGEWKGNDGDEREGQVDTEEVREFLSEQLMVANRKLDKLLNKTPYQFHAILKNPPYKGYKKNVSI